MATNILDFEYGKRGPFEQTIATATTQQSNLVITDAPIDDTITTSLTAWSSQKIQDTLDTIEVAGSVISTGSPAATQLAVWTDENTVTGNVGLNWQNNRLDVRGESSASNGTKIISMRHDGVGRGTLFSDGELLISSESTIVGSTTNHLQLQYSAGGYRNGTMFFDDTDFIISTDDYSAADTRIKLAPMGQVVWTPDGTTFGFGTDTPTSAIDVNSDTIRLRTPKTPAPSDTGTTGEIAWDAAGIYVCTAPDTWQQSKFSTIGNSGFFEVETKTENYTATEDDFGKYIRFTTGTLTLFDVDAAKSGGVIYVRNQTGITIAIQSGAATINGLNELDDGETVSIIAIGQNDFDIIGGR